MKSPVLHKWLARVMPQSAAADNALLHAPLLADAELDEIICRMQLLAQAAAQPRDVNYRQAGNYRSVYLGRGLDFEEVRSYQQGDELRDMDWRTTARTGKPYLKVYREEHQPALHIVIDRGASMRFGTRRQLKVTLAARLAACFAFAAMPDNTCIGGTLWQAGGFSLPCLNGEEGASRLVRAAIAACPPHDHQAQGEAGSFAEMLRGLDAQLQRGTRLIVISDFAQLQEQHMPLLMRLAQHHQLTAIQVLDSAEQALPDVGFIRFLDVTSGAMRWLDTASSHVRNAFQKRAEATHALQQQMFRRAGVQLQRCTTEDDAIQFFIKVYRNE